MTKALAIAIAIVLVRPAFADPGPPCEADSCDITPIDPGPRPWILRGECREDDVVGYRRCASFGQWAAPALGPHFAFELGAGWRHLVAPPVPAVAVTRMVGGVASSAADLVTSALRARVVAHGFYAGLELELGDLTGRAYPYGAFTQTGALAGLHAALGPFDLGGEVLVGARSLDRPVDLDPAMKVWVTTPVVELRARVELWLSPWITLAGLLGAGVLDRSEWFGSLAVGFHTRTYGGER
jgi:hypothetical protein